MRTTDEDDDLEVMTVWPFTSGETKKLQEATSSDATLQKLVQQIQSGWPENIKGVHTDIRQYFTMRDELLTDEGMVMKGERPVIPSRLRPEYIDRMHAGHEGLIQRSGEPVMWLSGLLWGRTSKIV